MLPALSREYWQALLVSLVFQVFFGLLSGGMLDGGMLLQMWCFSMAAYWGGLVLMMCRRPRNPTKVDLFLTRWSFPVLFFFVVFPLSVLIWRLRGVWD